MNPRWLLWTVRGLLLLGLAVSTALLVDYSTPTPEFCSVGSGCDQVRRSGLGYIPLGVAFLPVPVLGMVGFALSFSATLQSDAQRRRRWSVGLLAAGAFMGAGFIGLQGWIGHLCSLCLTVDITVLAAAALAFRIPRTAWETLTEEERAGNAPALHPWAWALLLVLSAAAPLLWPKLKPAPPVPAKVAALYQADKINVVEFADFQCPFCRRLHSNLQHIMKDYEGRVNFVRLHMPLRSHEYARPAAHAAVCAGKQGQEDAMADALFEAESLEPAAIRKLAKQVGLKTAEFERCLDDPATDHVVEEHSSILKEAGFQGLPTTYVGATKIVGAQPEEVFREAFDMALSGGQNQGLPAWLYWPLMLILGGLVLWRGRRPAKASAGAVSQPTA